MKEANLPGLSADEVLKSRAEHGENRLEAVGGTGFFRGFLASFSDPMIKILMIALAVNIIFLFRDSNWFETLGIALAILLATLVQTISEHGSERAFILLQEEASRINCRVVRGGKVTEIPSAEVVRGDVVLLQAGDRVPADGELLEGKIDVDESSINGEPAPVTKGVSDELFGGTVVAAGSAYLLVARVGANTVFGKISKEIQVKKQDSPLKARLGVLAKKVGTLGYIAAIITMLAYFANVLLLDNNFDIGSVLGVLSDRRQTFAHFLRALTLAVTVVVMAVPEGLPMMITVVLSSNMRRMLKGNVLVRKLVGVETAGSMNILFTDKTGTLTIGRPEATHFVAGDGRVFSKKELEAAPDKLIKVLALSVYGNSSASLDGNKAIGGNATDRASLEFISAFVPCISRFPWFTKGNVIEFNSKDKFMATNLFYHEIHEKHENVKALVKGAPEILLPLCEKCVDQNGDEVALDSGSRANLAEILRTLSQRAMRVLAVCTSPEDVHGKNFKNLTLVGLIVIRDEIRAESRKACEKIMGAGIRVVMVTGDAKETAVAIAKECGLDGLCITSSELGRLSDAEAKNILLSLSVVARAMPGDKSRLVRLAAELNLVTGMTGDGVNDAPALRQADVGFSMGSGTEVAKEASDMVILDDNIMSIARAVSFGRTVFKNIRKFLIYQLSICMCAVGVTVIGPLLGVDMPITVIQMLWINMVMDTLSGIAFSGEKAREKYMREPPKKKDEPILNRYMFGQIIVTSAYTTALCLFFLKLVTDVFPAETYRMTAFFALFMFCAIFVSFCARTHLLNLTDYLAANKPFLWIMGIVSIVQVLIIYMGGPVFRTAGLEFRHLALVALLASTVVPVDLLRKFITLRIVGKKNYLGT